MPFWMLALFIEYGDSSVEKLEIRLAFTITA